MNLVPTRMTPTPAIGDLDGWALCGRRRSAILPRSVLSGRDGGSSLWPCASRRAKRIVCLKKRPVWGWSFSNRLLHLWLGFKKVHLSNLGAEYFFHAHGAAMKHMFKFLRFVGHEQQRYKTQTNTNHLCIADLLQEKEKADQCNY